MDYPTTGLLRPTDSSTPIRMNHFIIYIQNQSWLTYKSYSDFRLEKKLFNQMKIAYIRN